MAISNRTGTTVRTGPMLPASMPDAFHVLAKPTGAICNLDCNYCFFLSKEMLYPGSRFRMADELLETYLRQLLESHRHTEVTVAWQGGEPTLMGLEFFERSVAHCERHKRPDQRMFYAIQTNGTKLDDDWCAFFAKHNVLVGLSMDGPRDLHDAYRVDKGGAGTYDRVRLGLDALKRHGVDFNILCTVNAANQRHPVEVYRHFRDDLEARHVQFIPIVERVNETLLPASQLGWSKREGTEQPLYVLGGTQVTDRSVEPHLYGQFLIAVFDEWIRRDVGTVFVQHFDSALANWLGIPGAVCVFSETCGQAIALEHNGDVYSCDHFVEPKYLLGNIQETHLAELLMTAQQIQFGLDKKTTLPRYCRECAVQFACHGECPKNRFVQTPEGEAGLNYLCKSYKDFFAHINPYMKTMAGLIRAGRYADEVMQLRPQQAAAAHGAGHEGGQR